MKTVAVIFGSRSSEHEVSCVSAANVASLMDTGKYELILIGITKDGRWLKADSVESIRDGSWKKSGVRAVILPDTGVHGICFLEDGKCEYKRIDVAFPVLHGLNGEDGTIQGLFELAGIPYVGCGVLASACSMDKLYTKIIVNTLGIRQAEYVPVNRAELSDMEAVFAKVEAKLSYPVFVKPSNAGSSKGVSKAHNREELKIALEAAQVHDRKILVEETIVGREIECGVLGDRKGTVPSVIGEVLAADEFYSFDAKYNNSESRTVIDTVLPEGKKEEVQRDAVRIFEALDGFGCSRVDFFLENETNEVVFNEINTLPGFTGISMYPMLFEASGIPKTELVDRLIAMAASR